jgi:4a-hydroxytetrahydrobiopterin dehydratase
MALKKLTEKEISERLKKLKGWELEKESGKLTAGFVFENFQQCLDFALAIGDIAERVAHHPDILVHDYKYVSVFVSTHKPEGITEKDFELIDVMEEELIS